MYSNPQFRGDTMYFSTLSSPYSYEPQTSSPDDIEASCYHPQSVENDGYNVCTVCGRTFDRVLDYSPAKRIYESDTIDEKNSKIQHTDIDLELGGFIVTGHSLIDKDISFSSEGYKVISGVFGRLFPDFSELHAERLAKFYFNTLVNDQIKEKTGEKIMSRRGVCKASNSRRKKFSSSKTLIMSSILLALYNENIKNTNITSFTGDERWFDIDDLNGLVDGEKTSRSSVRKCIERLTLILESQITDLYASQPTTHTAGYKSMSYYNYLMGSRSTSHNSKKRSRPSE